MKRAILCLLVAGCGHPHWSVPFTDLDRVPLSVTAHDRRDVWIVGGALGSGGNALVLHGDGSSWQRYDLGTDATLWWVAEPAPSDVWMVGERGTVFHGPPPAPVQVPTTKTLYGVWSAGGGDVWIVGGEPDLSGVILHQDQNGWHDLTPAGAAGAYFKVWGASSNDVFICGQGGALLRWDGSALTPIATGLSRGAPLFTVAGRAADDVWIVGGLGNALALHWDGSALSRVGDAVLTDAPGLAGVSVDSDGTVALVGGGGAKFRGRAGALSDESTQATHSDLHAVSLVGGELFAVGGNYFAPAPATRHGVIAHYGDDVPTAVTPR